MNVIEYLRSRFCDKCKGAGSVNHTTRAGLAIALVCTCLAVFTGPPRPFTPPVVLFTGATTEAPRTWPAHVEVLVDQERGEYVYCRNCTGCTFLTPPGQVQPAGSTLDTQWAAAEFHRACLPGPRRTGVPLWPMA